LNSNWKTFLKLRSPEFDDVVEQSSTSGGCSEPDKASRDDARYTADDESRKWVVFRRSANGLRSPDDGAGID
jgi:hypothetical protein